MTTQRSVAGRRLHRAVSLAAALLLASLPLAAQNRSRPSGSGNTGRTAHGTGSSRPSYSPPPSSSGGSDRSSTSSQPRTARPSDGGSREPHRQPPSRGDRDDRGRGGHGGHFYYGGGYYPYHYPYGWGNYGFWPGYYGWWWWGGYPAYGYGNYGYYDYDRDRAGALDFDVAPARTEIYLDGQYVGKVDGFDGWPRYLWLPKGTYDVVLYLDGYKTIARQISVYPGSVIQIDDRLEPGDSTRPEDLVSKSTERRDERMRYERERRERIDRGEERGDDDYDEDWRDRVRRDRGRMQDHDRDADEDGDRSSRKGRLVLDVEPEDASVYLDGRFVGTGSELALMRDGLPVTPGEHRLAIVRPGRKAEEREFDVDAGEEVEIEVELESESR